MNISTGIYNSYYTQPLFRAKNSSPTDQFISQINKRDDREKNGSFLAKNFGSVTGETIGMAIPLVYEIVLLNQMKKLKKAGKKAELAKKSNKFTRNVVIAFIGGQVLASGLQHLFDKNTKDNYNKIKQKFSKINTETSAKLSDELICSGFKGALFNGISGEIKLNKNILNDPWESRKIDKLIRHELVHAKQYETVARSKDGIKKINYSVLYQITNNAKRIPFIADEFEHIHQEIHNSGDKYKDVKISIGGAKVNLIDFIDGIHILLKNPDATYNDVPMIINEKYYQQVLKTKGSLTQKEEKKAELYYQAMLDYPPVNLLNAFNPFSSYRQNLLEKEAYKENPSWFYNLFS